MLDPQDQGLPHPAHPLKLPLPDAILHAGESHPPRAIKSDGRVLLISGAVPAEVPRGGVLCRRVHFPLLGICLSLGRHPSSSEENFEPHLSRFYLL